MINLRKKRKGSIIYLIMILSMVMVAVSISLSMITVAHFNSIVGDVDRNENYYIALAGVEMMYSALVESGPGDNSVVENSGTSDGFVVAKNSKKVIMNQTNYPLHNIGYVDVNIVLFNENDQYIYRITCIGHKKLNQGTAPKDQHIITGFIDQNNPSDLIIYDGIKDKIN